MKVLSNLANIVAAFFFITCASNRPFVIKETPPMIESDPIEKGHLPIGEMRLYYEVHGKGEGVPLVLLNGGGSTIEVTYSKILPIFAKHRKVIALDEQAHGRTTDRKGPVRFETSAEDVVALLKFLKVDKADLLGFSNGANVALQVAIRHPQLVRKMVFASSLTKKEGTYPQFWASMKRVTFSDMPQVLKDAFLKVNPDPQKLRNMFDKDVDRMRNFPNVKENEIRSVKAPVLVLLGDKDIPKPEHAVELFRLFPDSRLLILPGGHGDYLGEAIMSQDKSRYHELTAALIEDFLGSPN
ncbi:alpha/beta hydrolase family protein [Leptospira broomii serovar Hurstbridge str. 5399]|uniref:Alpha/beta hydrolase family protein n=1 Tax=Leptospira broomii serovar Hurstbridge str. 5399 TaxID=1049789 RepID=T0FFN5_9LEPT|nr:alpha/beta hydrolase [Leptospira broomii]EQA46696.1 alpha/beta hydrolase family protein [Leptospira broomii serovar Hurstbridge str. 5399]